MPMKEQRGSRSILVSMLEVGARWGVVGQRHAMVALTLRSLTLYIYGAPILDVSRSHTTTQHSR